MLFGTGLAFFFGKPYIQPTAPRLPSIPLGGWSDNPQLRQALQVNPLFLVGIALAVVLWWAFRNTRWGLIVRMTGDSAPPRAPWAISVDLVRFLATTVGGFLAGVGGAFLSLYYPGSLERGPVLGPGPDGGGAGHLRALEPARLLAAPRCCSAPPARSARRCSRSASPRATTSSTPRPTS